jgi:hypothetical protein
MGIEPRKGVKVEAAEEFAMRMKGVREESLAALERAARDMKRDYDESLREAEFEVGQKVLLEGENLKTNRPSKKLDQRGFVPFEVTRTVGERAYRLAQPKPSGTASIPRL